MTQREHKHLSRANNSDFGVYRHEHTKVRCPGGADVRTSA
jgi:hypothetical protein